MAGGGPIHMVTTEAFGPTFRNCWLGKFLRYDVGQAWASQNIDPKYTNPELTTSEPYVMGSHATCSGAWVSGLRIYLHRNISGDITECLQLMDYLSRNTVGGSAHKFSSGSFTEGRLAAKAAVKYIEDKKAEGLKFLINNARILKLSL